MMVAANRAGYHQKRVACGGQVSEIIPPETEWRGFARHSFNPDDFVEQGQDCYNCVTWAVRMANRIVAGFLNPVRQGRVKEIVSQLEPCA